MPKVQTKAKDKREDRLQAAEARIRSIEIKNHNFNAEQLARLRIAHNTKEIALIELVAAMTESELRFVAADAELRAAEEALKERDEFARKVNLPAHCVGGYEASVRVNDAVIEHSEARARLLTYYMHGDEMFADLVVYSGFGLYAISVEPYPRNDFEE